MRAGVEGDAIEYTVRAIAVDANGKIVVVGFSTNAANNRDLVVWRLNP